MSNDTRKALKKAVKNKKKHRRGNWLFIQQGDSLTECISKIITQFAVLVLVACFVIFFNECRMYFETVRVNTGIKDIYHTYLEEITDKVSEKAEQVVSAVKGEPKHKEPLEFATQLMAINPDTVGYVQIEGIDNISLPVVQRKNKVDGNEFYLKTSFDGKANKAGTVFLDYRATLTDTKRSDVLTLYGHNQKDRTMFGDLKLYKNDIEFYRSHPTITFCSNYEVDVYKIFACFVTETLPSQTADGKVFYYHNYVDFADRIEYDEYISNVMLRSQINTTVDTKFGDQFLVLSTCSNEFNDSRFVVFARRTRDGESTEVDTSGAVVNTAAKEPDWSVIY